MGQGRVRLGYLLNRARNIRPGNLVEFAQQTQKVSKAPLPVIIADMLWCSVKYDMGFRDYAVWDIRLLNAKERATWMTHPKSFRVTKHVQHARGAREARGQAAVRDRIRGSARPRIDRPPRRRRCRTRRLSRTASMVIAKPNDGHGGGGIELHETGPDTDPAAFRAETTGKPARR